MKPIFLAAFALLAGSTMAPLAFATPQDTVEPAVTAPLPNEANPLVYVQRFRGPKDEILRTLSLFGDKRAMLTTRYLNNDVALVQTGTWGREARANRFTVSLMRENGKPISKTTISFVGSPKRGGGNISSSGKNVRNYGVFGLTMVPRAEDNLGFMLNPHVTDKNINDGTLNIEAVGIKPLTVAHVQNAVATPEGDVLYWTTGGVGGYQNEGQTLYRFTSLIGTPRKLAAFPYRIVKVTYVRAASGRPALVVAMTDGLSNVPRLAVIDPIREKRTQLWDNARLTGISRGKITVSMAGSTRTFALDAIL